MVANNIPKAVASDFTAKQKRLTKVRTTTALRRGKTPPPLVTPPPDPILPDPDPKILEPIMTLEPTPAPAPVVTVPPPPPKELFVTVGNTKFFSEKDFLAEQEKQSPCGDNAPFAFNHSTSTAYCTYQDFLNAGFKLPTPPPKDKRRGKLCPPGETYWGGKCKEISFSESTFL